MPTLLHHLSHWRPFTALVVGDFMLDQQLYGDAERLSADTPEKPARARYAHITTVIPPARDSARAPATKGH